MSALPIRRVVVLLVYLFGYLWPEIASAEEARRIAQTAVFAVPVAGFSETSRFPGLVNIVIDGSIAVTEFPKEAYAPSAMVFEDVAALNRNFGRGGIHIETVEAIETDEGKVLKLAHGTQTAPNGTFDKWMAVYPGAVTALVSVQVLEGNKLHPEAVKAFFRSVRVGPARTDSEILASLSFDLNIEAPFHLGANIGNSGAMLMGGPDQLNSKNNQPVILIFHGPGPSPAGKLERVAENALRSTSSFRLARIKTSKPVTFAGLEGIELTGSTVANGVNLVFTQRFARQANGVPVRMVVMGPAKVVGQVQPQVDRIFASIRLRR